jgi:hypothetical protein
VTTPTVVEAWLRELFPEAAVESGLVDRLPDPSLRPEVVNERDEYHLFRVEPKDAHRVQIGVTAKALERLSPQQIQAGVRRAIESATRDGKKREDDRFIVTSAEVIFCERKRGKR